MSDDSLFSGVIAPVSTPFDARLEPDAARFVAHARWLLDDGCTGLAPFGTTGEALSLGVDERRRLLEALVEGGIDPARLMVGTGLCAIPETVDLTRHALDLGCGGVMMLPPFYFKGVSDDGLFEHYARVIERVNDDRLRVYLYHIPPQAVVGLSFELVSRLIEAFPGVVVGLKDSSGEWDYTKTLLDAFPGFRTLSGSEVFLLDNLRNGGAGCITATGNVNARRIRNLFDTWQGEEADAQQAELTAMRETVQQRPMIPMLKRILAHYRDDEDWARVRPPHLAVDTSSAADVIDQLSTRFGFSLGTPVAG
jgi:4-hydroxy-tetrahydrodipicolinate synthase